MSFMFYCFQARHAIEASAEAHEVLTACKRRFGGAASMSVASCIGELNSNLQDIKFRIDLVGCDADSKKYYVFANKVGRFRTRRGF
jgi:hypothetical protein